MEVFEIDRLILDFFLLVLGVSFDFTLDTIHKSDGFISQAFPEEDSKLFLTKKCGSITFNPVLVLLLSKEDPIPKEGDYKRYAFMTFGSDRSKIVLVLPTEVVLFHVRVSMV